MTNIGGATSCGECCHRSLHAAIMFFARLDTGANVLSDTPCARSSFSVVFNWVKGERNHIHYKKNIV